MLVIQCHHFTREEVSHKYIHIRSRLNKTELHNTFRHTVWLNKPSSWYDASTTTLIIKHARTAKLYQASTMHDQRCSYGYDEPSLLIKYIKFFQGWWTFHLYQECVNVVKTNELFNLKGAVQSVRSKTIDLFTFQNFTS